MTSDIYIFSELKPIERCKLLCGIVVPRPIALVTSVDGAGRVNAAPFSFFNVFSEEPAEIVLGLQHKAPGEPKDTTRNLTRAKSFVVNMVDEPLAETMNLCATDFPPGVSEMEALGIETAKSTLVEPPRIAAAPFAFECRRSMSLVFHETHELLIGEVLAIHARSDLTDAKTFYTDPHRYRPIGRLAGNAYCRQGDVFEMQRLTYEQWRKQTGR